MSGVPTSGDRGPRAAWVFVATMVVAVAIAGLMGGPSGSSDDRRAKTTAEVITNAVTVPVTNPDGTCTAENAVAAWPLRQRLAQLLMPIAWETPLSVELLVKKNEVGSIFVGGDQPDIFTSGVLQDLRTPSGIPVAVAVDDEGGRVQRIESLVGSMESAREMGEESPEVTLQTATERAQRLRSYGVTVNLGPVLDIASPSSEKSIGDRAYSSDVNEIISHAGAFAEGMRAGGVMPTFKHFPGNGRAEGDSHFGPVVTPPIEDLREVDLVPYRELLAEGPAWVMVGHFDVPGLTTGELASVSPAVITGLLRDEMGFDGVVLADELGNMREPNQRYGLMEAATRFLAAGGDIVVWNTAQTVNEVLDALEAAVKSGRLDDEGINASVMRVLRSKSYDPCTASLGVR